MSSSIINIDSWEHSKENILPVKSGRKGSALARIFSGDSSLIEKEKKEYEDKIKHASNDDDPLSIWIEYYEWTKENYPTSRVQQLSVIQSVTKLYRNTNIYKQDERYLRFWILYADMLTNPIEMFQYLFNKDIGTDWALFYEGRACVQENFGKYKDADETYNLGINRKVQPLDTLKQKYQLFTERMAERVLILQKRREERKQHEHHSSSKTNHRSSRKALSQVGGHSSNKSRILSYSTMPKIPLQNSNRIISILQDSNDNNSKHQSSSNDDFKVQWDEFASEKESTKENILMPSAWTGKTLPQKVRKRNKQCSFSIYIDPECEEPLNDNINETITPSNDNEDIDLQEMIKAIKSRVSSKQSTK